MLQPVYTRQFARDVKKAQKRGKDLQKFKIIAGALIRGDPLDAIHSDHKLVGNFCGRRECRIESDWLLTYMKTDQAVIFERMGSHSDLFKQ
jgi:mRNA interferase YafQ